MNESSTKNSLGLLFFGIALALGLIISASILSGAFKEVKLADQTITVKGYAEKKIMSDIGYWSCDFSSRSSDLKSAYSKLQSDREKIISYLLNKGISKDSIKIWAVNTITQFVLNKDGNPTNVIEGYVLTQNISIGSKNVLLIENIANESTSLIQEGIEINSHPPSFFYSDINSLKIDMLSEAAKDARNRAEQLAKSSGSSVGSLRSANQGVFQITAPNSIEVSDWGQYDVNTIEKSVKAVVTIDYSIK